MVFFVSFGHSKSFGLLKQTKRDQAWKAPSNPRFLTGFNNIFLPLLQNSLRHAKRVLAQTGFAIHQRAVTDVTARKMNRAKKVVSERPLGPVRLVIGDIRSASRPFGGVVVWEESSNRYHKHDPTATASATAHGLGLGHGQGCRFHMGPPPPAHRACFRSVGRPVHHQGLLGLKPLAPFCRCSRPVNRPRRGTVI